MTARIESRWSAIGLDGNLAVAARFLYDHAAQLFAATAGLVKLHRHFGAAVLPRPMLETAAQFEYLMEKPGTRAEQFLDFAHVSRYKQARKFVQDPKQDCCLEPDATRGRGTFARGA